MDRKNHGAGGNLPDLSRLIRSIQRQEGDPDCFGVAGGYCVRLNCQWRDYCTNYPKKQPTTGKGWENENPA